MAEKKQKTQEVVTVASFNVQGDQVDQKIWRQQADGEWHSDDGGRYEDKEFEKEMKRLKDTRTHIKIKREKIKLEG